MLNDFEMIIHKFPEREDLTILPIADVHFGALSHMTREWELFVKRVQENPNLHVVLAGDLLDNATKSSVALPWENNIRPSEAKRIMCD